MKIFWPLFAACFLAALFLTGFKKEIPRSDPPVANSALTLVFDNVAGNLDLRLDDNSYINAAGETFTVSQLQYFISNIRLGSADGTEYILPLDISYFLVQENSPLTQEVKLKVPEADYDRISFVLGIDSARNKKPYNFPEPVYDFSRNSVTKDGFELGRKLFYDPRLSRNNTIGCGTCHIQSAAFTHHGHDLSHGIDDRLGHRNSPPIMNLAWSKVFFWDGGVFHLDLQPLVPITAHAEMDEKMSRVLEKLRSHPDYPGLFKKAFGSEEITSAKTMKALSQFMLMCVSSNSKYDKVIRKEGEKFTKEEQQGYKLFKQKCSSCHVEPLFTDQSFRNNGITPGRNDDRGRFAITLDSADAYKLKVPTLRNLEFTVPYMHDGRFYGLDHVLDHYRFKCRTGPAWIHC